MANEKKRPEKKSPRCHLQLVADPPQTRLGVLMSVEEGEKLRELIRQINAQGEKNRQRERTEETDPDWLPPAA
jgi:hypothetical protein